jgi:hypothetical protein
MAYNIIGSPSFVKVTDEMYKVAKETERGMTILQDKVYEDTLPSNGVTYQLTNPYSQIEHPTIFAPKKNTKNLPNQRQKRKLWRNNPKLRRK